MNILLLLCHPRPGSFNHAAAARARKALADSGHSIYYHDLYAEGFNPVLTEPELSRGFSFDETVQAHSRELSVSDGLVVFHPDWWGQPPAVLKGWLDRVLRPGIAYDFEGHEFLEKSKVPLLTGKKGLVFCTSDSPLDRHIISRLWKESILTYCGMEGECFVFSDAFHSDASRRNEWLDFVEQQLGRWFPPERSSRGPLLRSDASLK